MVTRQLVISAVPPLLSVQQVMDDSVITVDFADQNIQNLSDTELPSTGGIGTTIFFRFGAILVIGAGVVLVTRRRMNAQ